MQVAIRNTSVADPGCLSQISDLIKTKRGGKNYLLSYLFCSHKFHKIKKLPVPI
jgi:hypothetical protein